MNDTDRYCRNAFINAILSPAIRQRLLGNQALDRWLVLDQGNALGAAHK